MSDNASLKIWQTLQPMVRKEVSKGTESSVKSKKMVVTTAYNASTKTVGVTEAFGKEIQVPVAGMINPDRLLVGTSVWVIALHGSWSNAMVCMLGDGQIPPAVFAPVNLLDNSDFSNPINQRGNNYQQTNWEYFIDRWILAGSNGTAVYYDINSADKSIGVSTQTGENIYLVQRVEKKKIDTTKKYTAVYKKTSGELVIDNNVIFGELENSYQLALVVPSGTYLKGACLYEGTYTAETLPPYVPKPYVVELAECQRYYVRLKSGIAFYGFVGSSGSNAYLYFDLPQQMRISNPTATTTGRFFLRADSGSVSASTVSNVVTLGKQIEISVAVSMTANKPFNGYAESSVEVSADL